MNTRQRFSSSLLIASSLFVLFTATARAAVAPESGVRLYAASDRSGSPLVFSPGNHNAVLNAARQNTISAIDVPEGYQVTLVDNDGARSHSQTFKAGIHRLAGKTMDNKADVIIVKAE